jgi:phi LC3 family holin
MKKINWAVRLKNKTFWLSAVPAFFLVLQYVLTALGIQVDLSAAQAATLEVVNAVFMLLAALGIVVDHTTAGVGDSALAITYKTPKK